MVTRLKGSNSGEHHLNREESRALKAWLKIPRFSARRNIPIEREAQSHVKCGRARERVRSARRMAREDTPLSRVQARVLHTPAITRVQRRTGSGLGGTREYSEHDGIFASHEHEAGSDGKSPGRLEIAVSECRAGFLRFFIQVTRYIVFPVKHIKSSCAGEPPDGERDRKARRQ